ncbi:hypothetical protein PR202_ga31388 [Eleusine coracana subsp. coracana]|uniref:Uncharacterized protein n=1 Tax=Eleusine coracana subsp. coracana TaxID=191504 RepID=A0AAV5DRK2_ELECO|nr:hypothetical protein PR202_ga31388 [Eleusine coracana subsp. coracana]
MQKRLNEYTEQHLSGAAKEVLVKSVAQSLPNCVMHVFQLPLMLFDELMGVIREFWWRGGGGV